MANIYFDQAMKTRPDDAWQALLKEVLKGDSKKIWHGELEENLTPEQRKLILPNMKNYVEKYSPSGEFDKSKVRVLVRGDLQSCVGETQGPVCRVESVFILISIAIYNDLEIMKVDITSANPTFCPAAFSTSLVPLDSISSCITAMADSLSKTSLCNLCLTSLC